MGERCSPGMFSRGLTNRDGVAPAYAVKLTELPRVANSFLLKPGIFIKLAQFRSRTREHFARGDNPASLCLAIIVTRAPHPEILFPESPRGIIDVDPRDWSTVEIIQAVYAASSVATEARANRIGVK